MGDSKPVDALTRKREAQARAAEARAEQAEIKLAKARLAAPPDLTATAELPAPAGPRHATALSLAGALGFTRGYLSKMSVRTWFPTKDADGLWNEDEVRAAIRANIPTWQKLIGHAPEPGAETARDDVGAGALEILRTSSDPLEIARAGTLIQARTLAKAYESGDIDSRQINGLKSALAEWRGAEGFHIDIERKRGNLVPLATVAIVGASLASYFLRAIESADSMLATQVERWSQGDELEGLNAEERRHAVHLWARNRSRELREAVADGLDALVAEALSETQD